MLPPSKKTTILGQVFGSLLIHITILSFFLSLPIYKPGTHGAPFEGFFVFLNSGGEKSGIRSREVLREGKTGIVAAVKEDKETPVRNYLEDKKNEMEISQKESDAKAETGKPEMKPELKIPDEKEDEKIAEKTYPETREQGMQKKESEEREDAPLKTEHEIEAGNEIAPPTSERRPADEVPFALETSRESSPPRASVSAAPEIEAKESKIIPLHNEPEKGEEKVSSETGKMEGKNEAVPKVFTGNRIADNKSINSPLKLPLPLIQPPEIGEMAAETNGSAANAHTEEFREDVIKKENNVAELAPRFREEEKNEAKKPAMGIPVSEALLLKDIKIEIFSDADMQGILFHLMRKAHPAVIDKDGGEKQKEVDLLEETGKVNISGRIRERRAFLVAKAEKGVYTFVMENNGAKTYGGDVIFRLLEGRRGEKVKEYAAVKLAHGSNVKFKFLIPDTVFWDDEDRFSGSIEDSSSITKFNYDSGLVWREEKGY